MLVVAAVLTNQSKCDKPILSSFKNFEYIYHSTYELFFTGNWRGRETKTQDIDHYYANKKVLIEVAVSVLVLSLILDLHLPRFTIYQEHEVNTIFKWHSAHD